MATPPMRPAEKVMAGIAIATLLAFTITRGYYDLGEMPRSVLTGFGIAAVAIVIGLALAAIERRRHARGKREAR